MKSELHDCETGKAPRIEPLGSTLSAQFLVAGGLLMLLAMVIVGWLFEEIVSRDTIRNRAVSSALFMQSLSGPLVLELNTSSTLSKDAIHQLDGILSDAESLRRFPHLEIWTPDGKIVYSRFKELIGKHFKPPEGLSQALKGEIAAQFADLSAGEHVTRQFDTPYLEVYSPLRVPLSGKIIAVAEIHEQTALLKEELRGVWLRSWAVVVVATSIIMAGLFGIVHRGSRLIINQNEIMKHRAEEAEFASREISRLKDRAQRASARTTELNEQFIRTIGADLHDGPSQHLGFIALQIDTLRRAGSAKARASVIDKVAQATEDALRELRAIAKQLLLPDIKNLQLAGIIERITRLHRARTGKDTVVEPIDPTPPLSNAVKICVFRFLQEGLNNAHRYAASNGLTIQCRYDGKMLQVMVVDAGAPFDFASPTREPGDTLGLVGLRERIESLGGFFEVTGIDNGGMRIEMKLDLTGGLNFEQEDIGYSH